MGKKADLALHILIMLVRFGLIIHLILFFFCPVRAQLLKPEVVTIEQGLSQGMIYDLLQTRDGFLWVATKDGLNRYDGYNFKVFSNDPFNSFSLADNTVTALFEDSRGWLWIGTESKGLDMYNPQTGLFYHFNLHYQLKKKSPTFEIFVIKETTDGNIWALQPGGGLICVPVPETWKIKLPDDSDLAIHTQPFLFPLHLPDESLVTFEVKDENHLLLVTHTTQLEVSLIEKTVQTIGFPPQINNIWDLTYGSGRHENDFWAINEKAVFRNKNNQITTYPLPKSIHTDRFLTQGDQEGNVWVLIDKQMWHLGPDEVLDYNNPDWVMDENPTQVTADRNGNLWVGTLGYGIRKFNPRKKLFHPGAAGTTIWGLWRDTRGKYYCKVVNKIYPYDPVTHKAGAQPAFPGAPTRLLDMVIAPSGDIWTMGRGEEENGPGTLLHYNADGTLLQSYSFRFDAYIYARILLTRSGKIWITGILGQLVCFDPVTARFSYYNFADVFKKEESVANVLALAEDGNGTLWLGTAQGLIKGIPKSQGLDFQLIQVDTANPEGLSNNSIACLLPDPAHPSGILWIGTKGGGINRLDLASGKIRHITTRDGLPNNVVYGIVPGAGNDLWCSTNRGLAKLSPRSNDPLSFEITTFTAAKGLQDNEFNTQAFSKAPNGELLFGGVNGLNHFLSEEIALDTIPPPVYIVGLEINHRPAAFGNPGSPVAAPLEGLKEIYLDYNENNLSIEFTALDFTDPAQNRYRYRLVGLDADWVETGAGHFAHFTHLSPGRYEFRVQGSNGEGKWQETPVILNIIIHPPWWRSNLAYLAYCCLLLWAGWQAYRFQIRRVQLREQLAYEHRETERVRALEQMKTNFFSNVTHEFRTPLTLMLEPLRQLRENPADPLLPEKLTLVDRNSKRLLSMVNQLLDLAKLEHGGMQLELSQGDIAESVQAMVLPFLPLAERKAISLLFDGLNTVVPTVFDQNKVELVLNNLLSNALKFTPEGGKVEVELVLKKRRITGGQIIEITVKDNGPGIEKELHQRIFERFYQVESPNARVGDGTGIGLALSKELAQLMGGDIEVDSTPDTGSVFTFWFPYSMSEMEGISPVAGISGSGRETMIIPELTHAIIAETDLPVVVVVEDNHDIRQLIRLSLAGQWQVIETRDGEEGVRTITEVIPDLVISDLMMPLKNGYEVCHELKVNELTAHIPVILLTAKANPDSKLKGLRLGADDYITKPFNTEELLARMNNLLENRRRLRQLYSQSPGTTAATFEEKVFFSAPDNEFLRRFTLLIDLHLDNEKLGVEEFAAKMFISRVQLHRKLKGLTGQSATDFIRNYRLDRAYVMLKNREGLVGEISMRVGFVNEKYFSTVFKEKFGVSPSGV